eukprot:Skav231369  [mRNA]  locus=scaffold1586:604397:606143:+ [translate_table: standard]
MSMHRAAKRAKTGPMINPLAAMMAPVNMMNQMAMLGGMGGMGGMGALGGGMNPVMNSMMHMMNPESNMDDDDVEVAESVADSSSMPSSSAAAPARAPMPVAAVVPASAVSVAGGAPGGIPDEDNDPAQGHVQLSDAVIRVTKYSELNASLIIAHRRVVAGMGQEVFQERILNQFGLVLTDEDVTDIAAAPGAVAAPVPMAASPAGAPADDEDSGDDNGPICVICHRSLTSARGRRMGTMSLFCGHTYHRFCIEEWRRVSRRGQLECPLRTAGERAADGHGGGTSEGEPVAGAASAGHAAPVAAASAGHASPGAAASADRDGHVVGPTPEDVANAEEEANEAF